MQSALLGYLFSAGAVTLAEMGDKTQLLAIAFATKYKAVKVMVGVFIATILNHALAVAAGHFLTRVEGLQVWVQGIASLSFILFGLWTIRGDRLDGEQNRKTRFGAVMTVTIAFFIAELGDKTQLATIALAAKFPQSPLGVLLGTTTGMLIADSLGIVVGVVLCRKIPERTIKLISAGVFVLFGLIGSFQVGVGELGMSIPLAALIVLLMAGAAWTAAHFILKKGSGDAGNSAVDQYCEIKNRGPLPGKD